MTTARAVVAARAAWVLVALAAIGSALAARSGLMEKAEREPHLPRPELPSPPPLAVKLPAPTPAEVDAALRRAFGDAVLPAEGPSGLVGDFNGDGTEDVAAPVEPAAGRLAEINDDVARWQLQDALAEPPKATAPREDAPPAVKVQEEDALLAVIHGYGPHGWRDEQARQCYLVRHAIGSPLEARPRTELLRHVGSVPKGGRLTGHVIFSSAGGRPGFVYWTGVRYAWHPLPSGARPVSNVH